MKKSVLAMIAIFSTACGSDSSGGGTEPVPATYTGTLLYTGTTPCPDGTTSPFETCCLDSVRVNLPVAQAPDGSFSVNGNSATLADGVLTWKGQASGVQDDGCTSVANVQATFNAGSYAVKEQINTNTTCASGKTANISCSYTGVTAKQ